MSWDKRLVTKNFYSARVFMLALIFAPSARVRYPFGKGKVHADDFHGRGRGGLKTSRKKSVEVR
jgi:hypothetical protein